MQVSITAVNQVHDRIESLKELCNKLDPYKPISADLKNELAQFQITEYCDPFVITNKLLLLLEDSIEELYKLQNKRLTD